MGLSFFERQGVKVAWTVIKSKLPAVKTYGPLVGGAILIAVTLLHYFGQHQAAEVVGNIGEAGGMTQQSPMTEAELQQFAVAIASSIALAVGIVRKVIAAWRDIKARKAAGVTVERRQAER